MEEKGASRGYRIFSSAKVILADADDVIKYNTLDVKTDAGPSFASGMARLDLFGVFDTTQAGHPKRPTPRPCSRISG